MEKSNILEAYKGKGLQIKSVERLLSKSIADAPTDKVIREIFQNTMENEGTHQVICGEIDVSGIWDSIELNRNKKFFMINNGRGIDDISKLESLYDSEKNPDGDLDGNNNTGVRLMGAAANKLGTAFITKYDGVISGFFMHRPNLQTYNVETYYLNQKECNPYGLMLDYGQIYNLQDEWTIVICLGETPEQNTFMQPDYKNEYISKDTVEEIIKNRYYDRPTMMKKGIIPLDVTVNFKKITFFKEDLKEVDGKTFEFETNLAKYVIKYSETFGNVLPKCGIVFQNEIFDIRSDGHTIKGILGDSKNFLTSIGAYNLKSKLSIMIFPSSNLKVRMDNYRTNLIVDSNEFHKGTSRLTLNDFVNDFITYQPENVKELIQNSNPEHKVKTSSELMDKLLKSLNGRCKKSIGMKIKKEKSIKDDIDSIKRELEIEDISNQYFEDLMSKYPLVTYSLLAESISLLLSKDFLKSTLEQFMKLIKSNMKDIIKDNTNYNMTILNLYQLSDKYNTISIKNVLKDMIELNDNDINNKELMEAYQMVLKVFITHLKNDISDKNKDSKDNNNESNKPNKEINPLILCMKTQEEWDENYLNVENKDGTFAFYTNTVLIINKEDKEFKDLETKVKSLCFTNNIKEEFAEEVVSTTMSLFGGYLSTFDILPEDEKLNLEAEEREDYKLKKSGESFSSHYGFIEQMIFEEMNNNINKIKGNVKVG